ncbi:alpha/beta hydrolase [Microbacterium sp.]|uniref:alpha/beta fold hydrolase n=1 Tax=Microbacterium sp. TaxID=51671 RepID=UPI002811743D|nr:alpha/beta hydrolase [Microbacterium sp.]
MDRIGGFTDPRAQQSFEHAYAALERLWPVESTVTDVATRFGPTRVRRSGAAGGLPLVLLHPLAGNGLGWHPFVADLAADRAVYALDTIGTAGGSVQTAPVRTGEDYAAWVDEVIAGLGIERTHLLGYSEGAWHAALTAAHRPDRIASLVLGEPGSALARPPLSVLARMIWVGIRPTAANFARFEEWMTPGVTLSEEEKACATASFGYRRRIPWVTPLSDDELRRITTPTLALFGSATVMGDPRAAAERLRVLPDLEVETYEGAGHGLLWQRRDEVLDRIREFLRARD